MLLLHLRGVPHPGPAAKGRDQIGAAMRLCPDSPLEGRDDVEALVQWAASAWDYLAMGDYPYESSYIINGAEPPLPAFPVRAACEHLAAPALEGLRLLAALAAAVGVFYNHTGDLECLSFQAGVNPETAEDADFWGYQVCDGCVSVKLHQAICVFPF